MDGKYDVVSRVQWSCIATEKTTQGFYKTHEKRDWVVLPYDPEAEYVHRSQLNDDIILSWCVAVGLDKAAVEAELKAALDAQA